MNVHSPARGEGESFEEYRSRRKQSHLINKYPGHARPVLSDAFSGSNRRAAVKAAGGIRQFKRQQRAAKGL